MKPLIISTITTWLAFLLMHGYYFFPGKWETPHLSYVPLLLFVLAQGAAMLVAIGGSAWRIIRGPKRLVATAWGLLAILPVFIWYSHVSLGLQMQRELRERSPKPSWYLLTIEPVANAIIDGVTRYQLPYRLEGKRVVMFYDDRIEQPEADLAAMDVFLEDEEVFLGKTMPGKLHWIRGTVVGLSGNAIQGVAIADPELRHQEPFMETFPYKELNHVDYHEAAHNVISTPSLYSVWRGNAPPMLLIEGWPQARSATWENLAYNCRREKLAGRLLTLEELVSPKYYFCADDRAYQQGGALVSVLLKHFGPEKFLELYFNCSQKTFADDVKRVYNMTLDDLDVFYRQELDDYYSYDKATEQLSPEEKALLEEFRTACDHQMSTYKKLLSNGTMQSTKHRSVVVTGDEPSQSLMESVTDFCAKDGVWFRFEETEKCTNGDETFESSKTLLHTPERNYHVHYFSGTKDHPPRSDSSCYLTSEDVETWRVVSSYLRDQMPTMFSIASPSFLDDFLWSPQTGLTVGSVTRQDDLVVITITIQENERFRFQLHLDPNRNWALIKATESSSNEEQGWTSFDTEVREYEDELDGVPLLKKRTSTREITGKTSTSLVTQTVEITHFAPTPAAASTFDPDLFPEFKDVQVPSTTIIPTLTSEQRLNRHLAMIAIWLLLSVGVIVWSRRSEHEA